MARARNLPRAPRACVGLALLAGPLALLAHPLDHPKRDELRLSNDAIELAVDEEVAPGAPAQALRALFDRDGNGQLDAGEQAALLEHLARLAQLHLRLEIDGAPVALVRVPGSAHGERLSDDARSTALLAVRVTFSAAWPAGSGDWRGRRHVKLVDDAPDATGHVPTQAFCRGCEIADSSSGTFAHDPRGDWVLGAEVSPKQPLELKVRLK